MAYKGFTQVWRKMTTRVLKIVSSWYISGTQVTSTATELNLVDADTAGGLNQTNTPITRHKHNLAYGAVDVTADAAEINRLDGALAGTAVANKAVILDGDKKINELDITTVKVGGVTVTESGDKLNYASRKAVATRIGAVTTGDMPAKVSLLTMANQGVLKKAYIIPDAAFSTTADAWGWELLNAGVNGSGTDEIAALDLSGAVANLVAHKPAELTPLSNVTVAALGSVVLQVTAKGSGADSKPGVVVLEFTHGD